MPKGELVIAEVRSRFSAEDIHASAGGVHADAPSMKGRPSSGKFKARPRGKRSGGGRPGHQLSLSGGDRVGESAAEREGFAAFVTVLTHLGFKLVRQDVANRMFVLMTFRLRAKAGGGAPLPTFALKPCQYKKR